MTSILLISSTAILYIIAYNTYGKFIANKLFNIDDGNKTPAFTKSDGCDFVPTEKEVLFGHHYTSIAGTGPIVGPAIGIIWGWLPALLWVIFGSIFMGAVHDMGAIIISSRNEGRTIGDIASDIISPRARIIFLSVIFLGLLIVLAIFCLVIAVLFKLYPEAVLSVWLEIPIAIWLGIMIYKRGKHAFSYSIIGLILLYIAIWAGTEFPLVMPEVLGFSPVVAWSIVLLIYSAVASLLPVTTLLQPRDYINGHELFVIMILLTVGVLFSSPEIVAPAINKNVTDAPPMFPFLFITIACGAISGFHSLVSSGTTSKQIRKESDAKTIGYGGMLMEGMLAVFVLVAVAGGIGLLEKDGLIGADLWNSHYASWSTANKGLGMKVGAFVTGSANMLTFIGVPLTLGATIMGVFVASFAGTTIDTAARLQRYVVAEIGNSIGIKPLTNKYVATSVAVISAGVLALWDGEGKGGLILWPLFGAANQLLATLALLVITVYLSKKKKPIIFTLIPFIIMLVMTAWAMIYQIPSFYTDEKWHLLIISSLIMTLELWMIIEAGIVILRCCSCRRI